MSEAIDVTQVDEIEAEKKTRRDPEINIVEDRDRRESLGGMTSEKGNREVRRCLPETVIRG